MYHVSALGKAIGAVLKPADDKMGPLVDVACEVSEQARKGPSDLEKAVDTIRIYFLKDGVQMVVDGYSLEEVTDILVNAAIFADSLVFHSAVGPVTGNPSKTLIKSSKTSLCH